MEKSRKNLYKKLGAKLLRKKWNENQNQIYWITWRKKLCRTKWRSDIFWGDQILESFFEKKTYSPSQSHGVFLIEIFWSFIEHKSRIFQRETFECVVYIRQHHYDDDYHIFWSLSTKWFVATRHHHYSMGKVFPKMDNFGWKSN